MSEGTLVRRILKALREKYPNNVWYKIHTGPYQERGVPDILGSHGGYFIALEVKLPGKENTVTKYQKYQIKRIRNSGGYACVVTTVKEARESVDIFDKLTRGIFKISDS